MSPAAALWVGAHMWAWLSPNSYHVLQCLAASVPVMAGYAQTKRAAATGQLAAGGTLLTAVLLYIDCANACMLHGPSVMTDCTQTKRAAATGQLAAGVTLLNAVLFCIDCAIIDRCMGYQSRLNVHRARQQQPQDFLDSTFYRNCYWSCPLHMIVTCSKMCVVCVLFGLFGLLMS